MEKNNKRLCGVQKLRQSGNYHKKLRDNIKVLTESLKVGVSSNETVVRKIRLITDSFQLKRKHNNGVIYNVNSQKNTTKDSECNSVNKDFLTETIVEAPINIQCAGNTNTEPYVEDHGWLNNEADVSLMEKRVMILSMYVLRQLEEGDEEIEDENDIVTNVDKNNLTRNKLREWASMYNIPQRALKVLFKIMNKQTEGLLPKDSRTFMKTPTKISILKVGKGEYWHQSIEFCLQQHFSNLQEPLNVSIDVNMDSLPIFKSSKIEFWPILYDIVEIPDFKPMVIGIYCGVGKPNNIETFLTPFVDELLRIQNGLLVNGNLITIRVRCFICDSPARAYIKGN